MLAEYLCDQMGDTSPVRLWVIYFNSDVIKDQLSRQHFHDNSNIAAEKKKKKWVTFLRLFLIVDENAMAIGSDYMDYGIL